MFFASKMQKLIDNCASYRKKIFRKKLYLTESQFQCFHFFQFLLQQPFSQKVLQNQQMRKMHINHLKASKQNKYDQATNLAIDLESQISRSIVLPRIASKLVESQLREYVSRRKYQEEEAIKNLRKEVSKLKRHVYDLEAKKFLVGHIKTQQIESYKQTERYNDFQSFTRQIPFCSHHLQRPINPLRYLECEDGMRFQRNTETGIMPLNQNVSYRDLAKKQNQYQLERSIKKLMKNKNENKRYSNQNAGSNNSIIIEKQKIKPKKKKHASNKQARKRLRKCIWAVYFTIFFPSLARKIYKNKLKGFMLQYPHDISKYYPEKIQIVSKIRQDEADLWAQLQYKLDIMKAIQSAKLSSIFKDTSQIRQVKIRFQTLLDQQVPPSQRSIHEQQTLETQLFSSKAIEFLLPHFQKIIDSLLNSFNNLMNNTLIITASWKSYSQGLLNNSFINNSYPKLLRKLIDSGIVKLNAFKQVLQVYDQNTQIMLLTFDVFCRIYCFNWYCKLSQNTMKYSQQNLLIGSFFLTLIYVIGQMMIQQKIKSFLKDNRTIDENQKKRNKRIRHILPLVIKKKTKVDLNDVNRLIYDPPLWNQVASLILEKNELVGKVQLKMINTGTQLFNILKQSLRDYNSQIKQNTLQQKYIIKGDKVRVENLQKYENLLDQKEKVSQFGSNKITSLSKIKMGIQNNRIKQQK